MKILITGGTGFIGRELLKQLTEHQVTVLTRQIKDAKDKLQLVDIGQIDYLDSLASMNNLNEFDAVINLAGEPIADKRWAIQQKELICQSRWVITEQLQALIQKSDSPPSVFISGSAVGYYGDQKEKIVDETTTVNSDDFAHRVCEKWESIAQQAQSEQTRVCVLRTGIVLGTQGGALAKMLLPYKFGLGGPLGSGTQYMPWIHLDDMVGGILHLLNTENAKGIFNFCSPNPVSNREFSQALAKSLKRPHLFFVPQWILNIAMGESSCLLLDSIRAKPTRLMALDYRFKYAEITAAFEACFKR